MPRSTVTFLLACTVAAGLGTARPLAAAPATPAAHADPDPRATRHPFAFAFTFRMQAPSPARGPLAPWIDGDPADSLYRAAREALLRNDYLVAARMFETIAMRYPKSGYAPDALYWRAFALYRQGGTSNLRAAASAADLARTRYPKSATTGDLAALSTRIRVALARSGDAEAAEDLTDYVSRYVTVPDVPTAPNAPSPPVAPVAARAPMPPAPPAGPGRIGSWTSRRGVAPRAVRGEDDRCNDEGDDDVKVAALNGLLQMDADRALPILRKVLARRDDASTCLRRRAVFMVAQQKGADIEQTLLDAVRNDPDAEVRSQGVFWLSQVATERSTSALDSILRSSTDDDLRERAIFALSQQKSPAATQAIRAFAARKDAPVELRERAIFWLGQRGRGEELPFLRELYGKLDNGDLKERVLFSAGQGGADGRKLLLDVAKNGAEDIELRKKAIFWLGQSAGTSGADLTSLYGSFKDREMKDQLIFALSQKRDDVCTDKLIEIARKEPDAELRKKAIFWLGQSHDPRAAKAIEEILDQ